MAELRGTFSLFDKDGSGTIDVNELTDLIKACGRDLTSFEYKVILNLLDTDRDGVISFSEFCSMWKRYNEHTPEDHLRALFLTADDDGSGYLSPDELRKLVEESGGI